MPLESLAALASAVTAVIALIVAVRNEHKVEKRFREDLELQEKIALASIAPEVEVFSYSTVGDVRIYLQNVGVGPARVRNLEFAKDGQKTDTLVDVLDLPGMRIWGKYWKSTSVTIPAGGSVDLLLQTKKAIAKNFPGSTEEELDAKLRACKDEVAGTQITYEVFDIIDNARRSGDVVINSLP